MYSICNIVYGIDCSGGSQFHEIIYDYFNKFSETKNLDLLNEFNEFFLDEKVNTFSELEFDEFYEEFIIEHYTDKEYSGDDDEPYYMGKIIFHFDPSKKISIDDIPRKPTKESKAIFKEQFNKLPEHLREFIGDKIEPKLFIMWSTS